MSVTRCRAVPAASDLPPVCCVPGSSPSSTVAHCLWTAPCPSPAHTRTRTHTHTRTQLRLGCHILLPLADLEGMEQCDVVTARVSSKSPLSSIGLLLLVLPGHRNDSYSPSLPPPHPPYQRYDHPPSPPPSLPLSFPLSFPPSLPPTTPTLPEV